MKNLCRSSTFLKLAATLLLSILIISATGSALAQTAEERARIDYKAAQLAMAEGKFEFALAKLEGVLAILGRSPDILVIAAQCAIQTDDIEKASRYIRDAFAAADQSFKDSASYKDLLSAAAELEVLRGEFDGNAVKWSSQVKQALVSSWECEKFETGIGSMKWYLSYRRIGTEVPEKLQLAACSSNWPEKELREWRCWIDTLTAEITHEKVTILISNRGTWSWYSGKVSDSMRKRELDLPKVADHYLKKTPGRGIERRLELGATFKGDLEGRDFGHCSAIAENYGPLAWPDEY